MREILFRGKRVDNDEWAEGAYCGYNSETPFGDMVEQPNIIIHSPGSILDGFWFQVDPETVGQYTGLTDKNGTKIFEDDVCYVNDGQIDEEEGAFIVEWDEDDARFILNGCYYIGLDYVHGYQLEVIGNIHDNPELLTEAMP